MSNFTVAFIGLPSSGKSSIINSLIGKRILESGICRTTTEYNLLDNIIEDDNNNKFQVMDLPGICDSEEHNVNFNELTNKHILNANLIIWISDVNKAFITTHEVNEYNRIKKILNNAYNETGKLYYLIIMLSKCDKDINSNVIKKDKKIKEPNDEISDSDEDTDINDLINKVHEKFPLEDIVYFNAFGRSIHNKKSTATLKKFISKIGSQTKHNIAFNISKYIENYNVKQTVTYYEHFQSKFILFKDSIISKIDDILEMWDNISDENKTNFLSKLYEDYPIPCVSTKWKVEILKIFQFISCDTIKNYDNTNILHNKLIDYYLYILINFDTIKHRFIKYTVNELIECINNSFELLNYNQQEIFYNKLLFDYSFNCENRVNILKTLDWSKKNYYNFEIRFNQYICFEISNNEKNFKAFYDTIYALITEKYKLKKQTIELKYGNYVSKHELTKHELTYDKSKSIIDNFNHYLSVLDDIVNDYDYILLNKIQILYSLICQDSSVSSYYKLIKSDNNIPYDRLESNHKWLERNDKICRKIFSNLQVEYNLDFNIDKFKPISKLELLYDINIIQDDEKYKDIENDSNSN